MNEDMAKKVVVSKGLAGFYKRMAKDNAAISMVAYCATIGDVRTVVDHVMLDPDSAADFRALTDGVARQSDHRWVEVSRILERGRIWQSVEGPEDRIDHGDVRFVLSQESWAAGRGLQPDQSGSLNR